MTDFSKLLNPEQCAAATAADGPVLVLAAAGTGKTRTLVHRVAYLIEQGVPADRLILLTFTNRAAREMLERAEQLIGADAGQIWAGTFHSICARMLRLYGQCIGIPPRFRIVDEDDQLKIVNDLIKEKISEPKDFPKKNVVLRMISDAKNESKPLEVIAERNQSSIAGYKVSEIVEIGEAYAQRLKELSALDFDDLLVEGLRLLKESEPVRELFQEHFLHVLVDEYQDTNGLQAEFTDLLAAKHRNIMAVGDDFQCIYTWRGAQIDNILEFPQRWKGCRIIKLERNYRSVPEVLEMANAIMVNAPEEFRKELIPTRSSDSALPEVVVVNDGNAQAAELVKNIEDLRENGVRDRSIAVLYRSHFHSIQIQMELTRHGIPFRLTSGVGVFEQVHVKDTLAFLRLLLDPKDQLSFLRLVHLLPGVGELSAKKYWVKLGGEFNVRDDATLQKLGTILAKKAQPVWPQISKCFQASLESLENENFGEIIENFLDFFYESYLNHEFEADKAGDRVSDLKELGIQIASSGAGLEGFLADVALMTNLDVEKKDSSQLITLSTIHQAKGMEWPYVFVPWCSKDMFPSKKALDEDRKEEERRLFYVVVTRAKDGLTLYTPKYRDKGDGSVFPCGPSEFVTELPSNLYHLRQVFTPLNPFGAGFGNRFPRRGSFNRFA